jgi:hypothetical protein
MSMIPCAKLFGMIRPEWSSFSLVAPGILRRVTVLLINSVLAASVVAQEAPWHTGTDDTGRPLTDGKGGAIAYHLGGGWFSIKNVGDMLVIIDSIRIGGTDYYWPTNLSSIRPRRPHEYATTMEPATSSWQYNGPADASVEIVWHSEEEDVTWGPWLRDAQDSRCSHRIGIRQKGQQYEHWLELKDLDPRLILDIKVWNADTNQIIGTTRSLNFQKDYTWSYIDNNSQANFSWTVVAEGT